VKRVVVLDAGAFDVLDRSPGRELWDLLKTVPKGVEARCAALTLAEVCRTAGRTRRVEAALRRCEGEHGISVVPTDELLAKSVGRLLADARRDSCHLADAHVVALCADADVAVVITTDHDDINHLAASVPAVRIITRSP
jgi:predicted nucleic acid-binding protein